MLVHLVELGADRRRPGGQLRDRAGRARRPRRRARASCRSWSSSRSATCCRPSEVEAAVARVGGAARRLDARRARGLRGDRRGARGAAAPDPRRAAGGGAGPAPAAGAGEAPSSRPSTASTGRRARAATGSSARTTAASGSLGRGVELLFERHDTGNEEALAYLEQRLIEIGVIAALTKAGFEPGDDVRIGDQEFELHVR